MAEGPPHPRRVRVITTQEAVDPHRLRESTVVVVDVLLATTTLVTIAERRARRLFAAGTLEDAARICATLDPARILRGGEQDALLVEGYDCGPYPAEYPEELVAERDVVFVSTNGTRAIARAASARRLLVASLRNAPAVARFVSSAGDPEVFVVCAGSRGGFALDDFAAAGVFVEHLVGSDGADWRTNDAGWLAADAVGPGGRRTPDLLRASRAGRWFMENGREEVLEFVENVGASELVVEVRGGELVPAGPA